MKHVLMVSVVTPGQGQGEEAALTERRGWLRNRVTLRLADTRELIAAFMVAFRARQMTLADAAELLGIQPVRGTSYFVAGSRRHPRYYAARVA